MARQRAHVQPFAGRIGGNQELVLDRDDPRSAEILEKAPDAAPLMTAREGLSLQGFLNLDYWKFGLIEGIGKSSTMLNVFVSSWLAIRPNSASVVPTGPAGVFATANFLGPLIGGFGNWVFLTLFIFSFSNVSGSHLNPTITMATFFARLISLPRMVIYIFSQTAGGTIAGLMLRAAYGTRDFTTGGCFVDTSLVPVDDAFLLEFVFCLLLIFLSFGVGLDPETEYGIWPCFIPIPCRYGAFWRELGLFIYADWICWRPLTQHAVLESMSRPPFPSYHWIHWVGPLAASIGHGIVYLVVPPWKAQEL
ncbi:MIP transporter [Penicillium atrosanguineum]|nr:MIP transporter [Penicillium atrosanguineum]